MRTRPRWRAALRAVLEREGEPERVLLDVVRQLDLPRGDEPVSLPALGLARAVVAVGAELVERRPLPTVQATVAAAAAFLESPTEETWSAYFDASTRSYPFGPGEGCHSTRPDRACTPGSGCRSGAGTLVSIAAEIGPARVVDALRATLLPWLAALQAELGGAGR